MAVMSRMARYSTSAISRRWHPCEHRPSRQAGRQETEQQHVRLPLTHRRRRSVLQERSAPSGDAGPVCASTRAAAWQIPLLAPETMIIRLTRVCRNPLRAVSVRSARTATKRDVVQSARRQHGSRRWAAGACSACDRISAAANARSAHFNLPSLASCRCGCKIQMSCRDAWS